MIQSSIDDVAGADPETDSNDRLVIYYLKGCLTREPDPSDDYLGNWQEDDFSFLFFSSPSDETIRNLIQNQTHLEWIDRYEMSYVEWQGGRVTRQTIGSFDILPVWETNGATVGDRTIILDPGVVFGNGLHPTTRICLEALSLATTRTPSLRSAQDMGSGTGLLSVAAWKAGIHQVLSVDFNRLAVRTTLRNIHLNGAGNHILAIQGKAEELIEIPADLLIANIHYDIMRHLVPSAGFLGKQQFILSGLLNREAILIEKTLRLMPVRILHHWEQDRIWHTYWGETYPPFPRKK